MPLFRAVGLPEEIPGHLFLHRMPGSRYDLEAEFEAFQEHAIGQIICLPPMDEVRRRSPEYARAIEQGGVPAQVISLPVEDYGIPRDRGKFAWVARQAADAIRAGESVLVHCAAGIGRTGMFATLVLHYLGLDLDQALERVRQAGSNPEASQQMAFVQSVIANERSGDG